MGTRAYFISAVILFLGLIITSVILMVRGKNKAALLVLIGNILLFAAIVAYWANFMRAA